MVLKKKLFATVATNPREYLEDFIPDPESFKSKGIDALSFCERTWCNEFYEGLPFKAKVCHDNVAVLEFDNYESWLRNLKSETRCAIRRASKRGLQTKEVSYSDEFAYGIWSIYNESPIRQDRKFNHYGVGLEAVKQQIKNSTNCFIGAYYQKELFGFIELALGDCTGQISQLLSLEKKRDSLPNNALIAKAVEICSDHGLEWLVYARIGNHPSLDSFKKNNGFKAVAIKRFYIPLTLKGQILLLFGLQQSTQDKVPRFLKPIGFKLYNYASRLRT